MKLVIPGGSGQVGTGLARDFSAAGHEVVVLSRHPHPAPWRVVAWDGESVGDWAAELDGADAVINLAGRSVNCRYGSRNRIAIKQSRLKSTRAVGAAIARAARPPEVCLQASTATIYAHRYDAAHDEATGFLGGAEPDVPETWRFSLDVATSWERAAQEAIAPHTRLVLLRTAIVMSPSLGGPFDILLRLVRWGLGGTLGDGRQYMSWIHDQDLFRALNRLIESDLSGAINLASPHPLPNAEFLRTLRSAWGIGFGLPANRWMLEIGAFLARSETELILKSRRVVPGRLQVAGFEFRFPTWAEAAADLCRRWREQQRGNRVKVLGDAQKTSPTPCRSTLGRATHQ